MTHLGDTTVVRNYGLPDRHRIDSVRVIWQSVDLENPRALLATDGRLIVGDRTQIHFLTDRGEHVRTVGQEGQGPGEFRSVIALGRFGGDTIAVYDESNQRISYFSVAGEPLGSLRTTPTVPYVSLVGRITRVLSGPPFFNRVNDSPLVPFQGGVLSLWGENLPTGRPIRTALLWLDLQADTATVVERWDGMLWKKVDDGYSGPVTRFGPDFVATLAPDGRIAVGDGVEYCIDIRVVGRRDLSRVCRDRAPVPVGQGVRRPDFSLVTSQRHRTAYEVITKSEDVAKNLPHYDRMLFDRDGRLWVRTLGAELAEIHPYVLLHVPELLSAFREWDVFDRAGRLMATLEIPPNFEPVVVTSGTIYGFFELPTGEVTIGATSIPF